MSPEAENIKGPAARPRKEKRAPDAFLGDCSRTYFALFRIAKEAGGAYRRAIEEGATPEDAMEACQEILTDRSAGLGHSIRREGRPPGDVAAMMAVVADLSRRARLAGKG